MLQFNVRPKRKAPLLKCFNGLQDTWNILLLIEYEFVPLLKKRKGLEYLCLLRLLDM
jgi:hypothetical protein